MKARPIALMVLLALAVMATPAMGVKPTQDEVKLAKQWATKHLTERKEIAPPFSFVYDGKPSSELLGKWEFAESRQKLDANRTQTTQTYTDKATGLQVRCMIVQYADYPTVEWTVYAKNTGDKDTPILEKIQGLDESFERKPEGEFVLNGIKGDFNAAASYQPYQMTLAPGANQKFAPGGGWGTCGEYPFYNLQYPGGGMIVVIGWPGQWASSFTRDDKTGLRIVAGQGTTRMSLKPGEEVRSPLMVLLFWEGTDRLRAQNIWRSWMVTHNMPRTPDGKLSPTQLISGNQGQIGFTAVTEANQKEYIDLHFKRGIKIDGWDIDAGWFDCPGDWWLSGTWEVDKARFPNGIKPVSDLLHSYGAKLIVWFEPERVGDMNSWLGKNHPEWLTPGDWDSSLLDLGMPAARQWVLDHIDKAVTEYGMDWYRQDFNIPALRSWQTKDTPDRQGITENLHNQGYLWWWDELRKRHPNILMDCCASGGRRNDLETLRRAVPLHRCDYVGEPTSQQGHHYGLSQWVPYHGAGYCVGKSSLPPPDCPPVQPPDKIDSYFFRAAMSPSFGISVDVKRDDYDYAFLNRLIAQYKQIKEYYYGDFYPLTDYSLSGDAWMGWQYYREDMGEGSAQAFRHEKNTETTKTLLLHGLDPAAQYKITNVDTETPTQMSGKDLMEKGLTVELKNAPAAALVLYKRI